MWLCIYLGSVIAPSAIPCCLHNSHLCECVMTLELRLSAMGLDCWLDQNAAAITKDSMQDGVEASKVFLLFLSHGVLTRPFCLFEIRTALSKQKRIMLMHESDGRHGAFDFGSESSQAPPDMAELLEAHESIPWRRRRFEQDAILHELIKNSGLGVERVSLAAAATASAVTSGTPVGRRTRLRTRCSRSCLTRCLRCLKRLAAGQRIRTKCWMCCWIGLVPRNASR